MSDTMELSLDIKQPSEFFWLRKIRKVNINQCCARCFIGEKDNRMYYGTRGKKYPLSIELEIEPAEKYVAYYLCGLSRRYVYENNTHVAFVHTPGELLQVDTPQIEVKITNARRVDFENEDYKPNPPGEFTEEQRACRNWIFANYIKDGKIGNLD